MNKQLNFKKQQHQSGAVIDGPVNIVVALPAEARPIISYFRLRKKQESPYPVFSNEDGVLRLIISGVGKTASAEATTHLQQYSGSERPSVWINVGISGHSDLPVGTCILAQRVADASTGKSWYPSITFKPACKTASVKTVDQPVEDYPGEDVYEMEAAGFYAAAIKYSDLKLVHVLKVISDNQCTNVKQISKAKVIELIGGCLKEIEQTVVALGQIAGQCALKSNNQEQVHLNSTQSPKTKSAQNEMDYAERFATFSREALYQSLDDSLRKLIREIGFMYRMSFQELRQVVEIAVDFRMWEEPSFITQWNELEHSAKKEGRLRKKEILQNLKERWTSLRNKGPDFKLQGISDSSASTFKKRKLTTHDGSGAVFGLCPVASEKTVCCNLRTIDAVQGCGLDCSYCSIQTFYDPKNIIIETNLAEKLKDIVLDPKRNYHIGSGQSSDSLVFGNRNGVLEAQLEFARLNPNVILELKTKSKNIGYLLETDMPGNVFVCWSLNTDVIIVYEEHGAASLRERLMAARAVADKGVRVGFHFHPIVRYRGWRNDYCELIETVLSMFTPNEVALVSFGTLTFIKPAIKNLRLSGIRSKVLQMPLEEAAGKLSYPMSIKEELFQTTWKAFKPWHDSVFFYFCMEERRLWESVFGYCYDNNETFNEVLFEQVSRKLFTT